MEKKGVSRKGTPPRTSSSLPSQALHLWISCVAEHNEKPHPLSGTDSLGEYQISLESKMLLLFNGSVT